MIDILFKISYICDIKIFLASQIVKFKIFVLVLIFDIKNRFYFIYNLK